MAKKASGSKGGDLAKRVEKAIALIEEARALLPELDVSLTGDERQTSEGRFHDGEIDALRVVLAVVEKNVAYFSALADEDEGHDPETLETTLLAERLADVETFGAIRDAADAFSRAVGDATLARGALVRPVLLAAYRMGKPNPALRGKLAKAIDFYSAPAKKASKTRAAKKKGV